MMSNELLEAALTYVAIFAAPFVATLIMSSRARCAVFPRFIVFKNDPYRIARIISVHHYYKKKEKRDYCIEFPGDDQEYSFIFYDLEMKKFSRAEWKSLQNEARAEEVLDA